MAELRAFIVKLKRALIRVWYWDIWHLQPSAPLSWRYILPKQSAQIQLHRHLWWHSRYKLPGLLWLPLEVGRWLHWQIWAGSRGLRLAVNSYGTEVEGRFGISIAEQRKNLSYWVKQWCINPYTGYHWQLFRPDVDGLAVIYDNQTSAYHALQNRKTGASKADHRLLGDKIALAEKLSALGVPMVATERVSRGDWQDIEAALTHHPKLFCKLRSGNQGESAFAVWQVGHSLIGQELAGKALPDTMAVKLAWQTLSAKGEVLIQPLLENHLALAPTSPDGSVITLRVVTRVDNDGFHVWFAELQIPGKLEGDSARGFWRIAVKVGDGALFRLPNQTFLKKTWQEESEWHVQQLARLEKLPFWSEICQHSLQAHQQLPKVWAIAWDWVITPDGPILLEGNSGWGLETPQMQLGGFSAQNLPNNSN